MLHLKAEGTDIVVYRGDVKVATVEFEFCPYEHYIECVAYVIQHVKGDLEYSWGGSRLMVTFNGETVTAPIRAYTQIFVKIEEE